MMIELKDALQIVLDSAKLLGTERVELSDALDRILAEDVASDIDMPPFDKATVDGYACRRADLGDMLTVVETIPAGVVPAKAIGPSQCAKIMTGAAVPEGANCVIMIEQTEQVAANRGEGVPPLRRETIWASSHPGAMHPGPEVQGQGDPKRDESRLGTRDALATKNKGKMPSPPREDAIRFAGERTADNILRKAADIQAGQVVVRRGSRISAQHIAALASVGCVRPLVAKSPRVGVVASGDELVPPAAKPGPSQIRNSNSLQLAAQVGAMGLKARDYGVVKDVAGEIDAVLKRALAENDVVIVSGGVSVGDFDLVPEAMRRTGVKLLFEKIAVKPGKPTVFGLSEQAYCFGSPGNPVSTFVVFELVVKPFLYRLMGHDYAPRRVQMKLAESITRRDTDRQTWIPVKITDAETVKTVEYHGSAHILALCEADGLISMDIGSASIRQGAPVHVRLL